MKGIRLIFFNVILLTATSLVMRTIGLSFQVYLSNKIGAAGIGLYQLVLSVYFLTITFSTSGVRLASTRLIAEELGQGQAEGARKALRLCVIYALAFGLAASWALFISAKYIGTYWLCDLRTIVPLRILATSLPFISLSSAFGGYFMAVRRVVKSAAVQIVEQFVKISVTIVLFTCMMPSDLEKACFAIVVGTCVGECVSFLLLFFLHVFDIRRYRNDNKMGPGLLGRMLHITLPVALGAYVSSAMRTVQQLLIPVGFKKSGASSDMALSTYGSINGMVIPVIMYPSVLFSSLADLIVPELAECKACGNYKRIDRIVFRLFHFGMLFCLFVMSIFLFFPNELSSAIYKSTDTAYFMYILSPLIPLTYLDTLTDAVLKGIGEQVRTMYYNIIESFISVIFIYFLLPRYAINGYIFIIIFARALNFSLSLNRLIKVTSFRIRVWPIVKALFCIFGAYHIAGLFIRFIGEPLSWIMHIAVYTAVYFLLLNVAFPTSWTSFVQLTHSIRRNAA